MHAVFIDPLNGITYTITQTLPTRKISILLLFQRNAKTSPGWLNDEPPAKWRKRMDTMKRIGTLRCRFYPDESSCRLNDQGPAKRKKEKADMLRINSANYRE
jgi:hypothetical protein